ncbi:MAG: cytochrome d ubiquinol oxidase subunit II [Elusimicrobia bacterium]|nr:cytochrome d ubiquinol oxidase subunit II [Elusimicrobiota bacterium]
MEFFQVLWYVLWSVLWIAYFATDGFDLGAGMAMNFISSNDSQKRAVINAVGPFWDGNEVWLITAGGATFAAFPSAYAYMFSWLYIPLFLLLISLIIRGVSFELRGKTEIKKIWDIFIFAGSFFASFLLGAAFGNLWAGIPVGPQGYLGGLLGLLNFSGILTGISLTVFFCFHGLLWLLHKIEGNFKEIIYSKAKLFWYITVFCLALFLIFLPLSKNPNFQKNSFSGWLCVLFYALSAISLISVKKALDRGFVFLSFLLSFIFIIFWAAGGFAGQYPNLIPSNLDPVFNTTAFNSSSSLYTLKIMSAVALIFVPIVIAYQIWVYKLLNHKINPEDPSTLHY